MISPPFVSIIVAFYKNSSQLKECISNCEKLDYPNFEIIAVGNTDQIVSGERVRWLKVEEVAQGPKKDAGVANAKGEIVAFVDDDAFPRADWIKNAMKYFKDASIGAVCGPGVAPPNQSLMERGSSAIWDSWFGSGPARYRYVSTKMFYVDCEAPGYNLFVRRSLMIKVGGIASKYRSGEDAILSEKIRKKGMKIVYAPDVVVYHRRRPLLMPFLRQIATYGMHRGYFLKNLNSASNQRNPAFALPLVNVVVVLIAFALSFFAPPAMQLYFRIILAIDVGVYLGLSFFSSLLVSKSVLLAAIAMFGIPVMHFTYALGYVRGLTMHSLGEKPSH